MAGRVWGSITLLIVALFVSAAAAKPISGSEKEIAGWRLVAFDDNNGRYAGCAALTQYQNGITMHVSIVSDGHWEIGWQNRAWNFKVGEKIGASLFVDSAGPYPITLVVSVPTDYSAKLPQDFPIADNLRKGQVVTVLVGKARLNYALNGSSAALTELESCHNRYAAAPGRSASAVPESAPAARSSGMPPEVTAAIAGMQKNCRMMNREPPPVAEYVTALDLTGDGIDDWVVNTAGIGCAGFSGSGGSAVQIYAGAPNGHASKAFDTMSLRTTIDRSRTPPVVWIGVGGRGCGDNRDVARALLRTCQRPLLWNAAARRFDEGPQAPLP
jgi:hypothetical protein